MLHRRSPPQHLSFDIHVRRRKEVHSATEANAGNQLQITLGVYSWLGNEHLAAMLLEIVRGRQQIGGFLRTHGAVCKVELCHITPCDSLPRWRQPASADQ